MMASASASSTLGILISIRFAQSGQEPTRQNSCPRLAPGTDTTVPLGAKSVVEIHRKYNTAAGAGAEVPRVQLIDVVLVRQVNHIEPEADVLTVAILGHCIGAPVTIDPLR